MSNASGNGLSATTGTWNPNNDSMNPPRAEVPPTGAPRTGVGMGMMGTNQAASESGILDSTRIDPLNRKSEAQEWSETTRPAGMGTGTTGTGTGTGNWTASAQGVAQTAGTTAASAATTAAGAAKFAYGHVAGNQELKNQGSEQLWGKQ